MLDVWYYDEYQYYGVMMHKAITIELMHNTTTFHIIALSKRNLTFNLLDPNQIRLTLRYTNIMNKNKTIITLPR